LACVVVETYLVVLQPISRHAAQNAVADVIVATFGVSALVVPYANWQCAAAVRAYLKLAHDTRYSVENVFNFLVRIARILVFWKLVEVDAVGGYCELLCYRIDVELRPSQGICGHVRPKQFPGEDLLLIKIGHDCGRTIKTEPSPGLQVNG
jgi:hypothetical protein